MHTKACLRVISNEFSEFCCIRKDSWDPCLFPAVDIAKGANPSANPIIEARRILHEEGKSQLLNNIIYGRQYHHRSYIMEPLDARDGIVCMKVEARHKEKGFQMDSDLEYKSDFGI